LRIGLMTIATGEKYRKYASEMFHSAKEFFPAAEQIVFTDGDADLIHAEFPEMHVFQVPSIVYPEATLLRFHFFLTQKVFLSRFDYLYYCDADMRWVAPVGDILADGLVATLHPGFAVRNTQGTPERRKESTAYLPERTSNQYFCGGFQGGRRKEYLAAADVLAFLIDLDRKRKIMAVWHDESHWVSYLHYHPPAKILTPSYCTPEESLAQGGYCGWTSKQYPPILLAVDKKGQR
jgi:hypothetical protein